MSFEQPNLNTPNEEEIQRSPIPTAGSENFDAKGAPRERRMMPTGEYVEMSQEEYLDAMEGLKDN